MKIQGVGFAILLLVLSACATKRQEVVINGQTFVVPEPVSAERVPNPVKVLESAGAIPEDGARKGSYAIDGYWYANGRFPSSPENEAVGAATQSVVKSFPDRKAMEAYLSKDASAMGDDYHRVLIGEDEPFYMIITGMMGENGAIFDVDIDQVASLIRAEERK